MKHNLYPTAEEIGAEALEALNRLPKKTPEEDFTDMVRSGFINSRGEVTRLIGGSAEPEPDYEIWTPDDAWRNGKKAK